MRFLAFALEVFLTFVRQHDQFYGVSARLDEERVGARLNAGNRGGLGILPLRAVGIHSADGFNAFEGIAAVSAVDGGDGALVTEAGHEESLVGVGPRGVPLPVRGKECERTE